MRLSLRLFGLDLLDLTIDTDPPSPEPERPKLEASGSGQFETGFGFAGEDAMGPARERHGWT